MRRLVFVIVGGVLLLALGASPALADNGPHLQGAGIVADSCAGCHRTHTAKAGDLLTQAQPQLCYTCHGATGTGASTDVESGLGYATSSPRTGVPGALRGGGFAFALINSAAPSGQSSAGGNSTGTVPVLATGSSVNSTHSVNGTSQMAWGNGAISGTASYGTNIPLRCGSCHNPHGSGTYRILRPTPSDSGAATGVSIADTSVAKTYTTSNYWQVADTQTGNSFIANVSNWCTTCHTRYLSSDGDTNSGDAVYTYRHKSDGATQGSPSCVQCHVAHGSNASVGGTYSSGVTNPDGTAAGSDSRLLRINNRGVCQMCHNR